MQKKDIESAATKRKDIYSLKNKPVEAVAIACWTG